MDNVLFYLEDIYDERLTNQSLYNIINYFTCNNSFLIMPFDNFSSNLCGLQNRVIFETDEAVYPFEEKRRDRQTKWCEVTSFSEFDLLLKNDILFECLIHPKKGNFTDYSFALYVQENMDGYSLVVCEKNIGEFERMVLPKIMKEFSNILTWGKE
ncbi:hypothetical protein AZ66_24845 [Paenibacillus sp. E194]|uniref:hypothetical protein n=1 Tax=Paenibacillus sp. E194 TaxID=1458845 RepID=UPI0005CAA44A|nr:hypothetical protein [Paenibacillus sp. E194]KJB85403.1 hypothetical protein AZ66_24845 [Paenibacillus sp. E194]